MLLCTPEMMPVLRARAVGRPVRQQQSSVTKRHALFLLTGTVLLLTCLAIKSMGQGARDASARRSRLAAELPGGAAAAERRLPARPRKRFLLFFSGHQGSSALADMLATDPDVFIPGFEPLDFPGLTAAQKTAFMEAVFTFPSDESSFGHWRQEVLRGRRIDRRLIANPSQLAGKTVAGFKMRPYVLDIADGGITFANSAAGANSSSSAIGSRTRTAASGLSPAAFRALLERYNVSVVVTLRRNRLKEALSWYKARQLGIHQFKGRAKAAVAVAGMDAGAPGDSTTAETAGGGGGAGGTAEEKGQEAGPQASTGDDRLASGGKVHIDIAQLQNWLEYSDAVNAALREAVASCRRPALTVWYEDFLTDPLGQAQRAAAFVGVPHRGRRVKLSSKFRKAGPDAIQDWVANFQELCDALRGTPCYEHLDAAACNQGGTAGGHRSASADGLEAGAADAVGAAGSSSTMSELVEQPQGLLRSWCVSQDQAATGWSGLTDAECMQRFEALQAVAAAAVRGSNGTLLFKHVHKAGGSTLCKLAHKNMAAESAPLPLKKDWDTNCVPYEAFLGPHLAVGSGAASLDLALPSATAVRSLQAHWLGGACWLGFLTPAQLRVLPHHFRPLSFVASEGPLPDVVPLDAPLAWVTMLRQPLDRVLSSYRWWQFMMQHMPQAPAECRAYSASANATLEQWLEAFPDNWMTRELVGRSALYQRRPLTESDLLVAQQRLHYFAAVLLLEAPNTSMALMRQLFGWQETGWEDARAGSRHSSNATSEVEEEVLRRMRQLNELDMRLYDYARLLHTAQLQRAGLG